MSDKTKVKKLEKLLKLEANSRCADCQAESPEWASSNLGVFLCVQCAAFHRRMGSHVSKVKSITLDKWDEEDIKVMAKLGNEKAKQKYEKFVPLYYRKPLPKDPDVLREQWIRAKYERKEFMTEDADNFLTGIKEGYLYKQGKDNKKFQSRRFVLNEGDFRLSYFIAPNTTPKEEIMISKLNVVFCPEKISNPNGIQLLYETDQGKSRSIYLYTEEGKDVVDWYVALRAAKFRYLRVQHASEEPKVTARRLMVDFSKEGWLWKTAPSGTGWKRRWCSLYNRRLMYALGPLEPYPKGEIYIGDNRQYKLKEGLPEGVKPREDGFGLTLRTPDRTYYLSMDSEADRNEWQNAMAGLMERPEMNNPQVGVAQSFW